MWPLPKSLRMCHLTKVSHIHLSFMSIMEGVLSYLYLQTLNCQPFLSSSIPLVTGTSWVHILGYQTTNWTRSNRSAHVPHLTAFAICYTSGFTMEVTSRGHPLVKPWQRCLTSYVHKMLNSNARVVYSDICYGVLDFS